MSLDGRGGFVSELAKGKELQGEDATTADVLFDI